MKNLIGLTAAMLMMGAPAFAKAPRTSSRAHKPRVAHHKKAHARKARHSKKSPRPATPPSDVVEMPTP